MLSFSIIPMPLAILAFSNISLGDLCSVASGQEESVLIHLLVDKVERELVKILLLLTSRLLRHPKDPLLLADEERHRLVAELGNILVGEVGKELCSY